MRRRFGGEDQIPPDLEPFIASINEAYREFDADRAMIERSLELSSQELLQANSDLGAVLEAFLDIFFHIDRDGVILAYRVGTMSDVYIPPEELIGKRIQNIPWDHVGAQFEAAIKRVHTTGSRVDIEYRLRSDEGERHYASRLLPLRNGEIAVIVRNVTERHVTQQRERELQERLMRSERMESLGILAGGVAHDLNNILGPIVAYPELIAEELPETGQTRKFLGEIEKSAHRAAAVVQDLLTMARRGNYILEPVDVNHLVENYAGSLAFKELQGRHPKCTLQLQLGEDLPPALGVSHQLNQAIMNLVMNAYESVSHTGSVTVITECAEVREHASIYVTIRSGQYVILRVRDTGTGIPPENLEHIFEPFYSKKKMGRSGSGLGLTVVYGVVRDMGGYVDVDTQPNTGTEMRLYLPVSDLAIEDERTVVERCTGHERILIVDDTREQRQLAKHILSDLGYAVETASNGREAIAQLQDHAVNLVLMDMIMEDDLDGLDTYKAILKIHPNQKCLVVSGFSETDRVRETLECGAGGFISKPYSIDQLSSAIREELDRA
ncbi:MAG: response regulator [Verrucomicrobia bacterium]|nr:response regulator [Verrucomicrobiota bacterium]